LCLIFEHHPGDTLAQLISENKPEELEIIGKISIQIVTGMEYLHLNNIAHLYLRPENIMIGHNGIVKIGDFGISKTRSERQKQSNQNFHLEVWDAPEVCIRWKYLTIYQIGESICNSSADVFSFGVILWVIALVFLALRFEAHDHKTSSLGRSWIERNRQTCEKR
jgi:serine/threonine protein kinase